MDYNKFQHQYSFLLQLVYEANRDGIIDQYEKFKIKGILLNLNSIKEMIITKDPAVTECLERFEKTKNLSEFITLLKKKFNNNPNEEQEEEEKQEEGEESNEVIKD